MPRVLAWSVETATFQFHPAGYMPVGLATIQQARERVKRVYAMFDAAAANGRERRNLASHPLSLRPSDSHVFHIAEHYDEMPAHTERGHLIADVFGGDDDERNLIPMPRAFNQQIWKREVEARLESIAAARRTELLGMLINCDYKTGDPRSPSQYEVNVF